MAIRAGLGGQLGFVAETTYGTYVPPTRFLEFNSEGLDVQVERIESQGIRKNTTVARSARWARNFKGGGGPVTFEVADKGFGLLFKHALGAVSTGAAGLSGKKHTFTLGDMDNLSLTVQKGVPDVGGTVRALSFLGCVITEWSMSLNVDGLLTFSPTFDARDFTDAQSLASASFAAGDQLFGYQQAVIKVAGTAAKPMSLSITGNNGLKTDRWYLSGTGTKGLPVINQNRALGGELTFEFEDMTQANRFIQSAPGTEVQVEAKLTGRSYETGQSYSVEVILPACRFDGGVPQIGGPDVVTISTPFTALDDGTNQPITINYTTTDTTP